MHGKYNVKFMGIFKNATSKNSKGLLYKTTIDIANSLARRLWQLKQFSCAGTLKA
jgi:hypothetical protein